MLYIKNIEPLTLNFVNKQADERGHIRYKHARLHLSRNTSPEANITDMLKLSLARSDPKMSDEAYQVKLKRRKAAITDDFPKEMAKWGRLI